MKLPAFQFYPADWRKDPGVQALSYHDRGVWFEILCLMHESEQRGKLTLNGKPMPEDALARLLGLDKQNLTKVINNLLEYGVASRDEQGFLINRRMIKDENIRQMRAIFGQKGGSQRVENERENLLLKQNPSKILKQVKQKPTPSSSSSLNKSNINITHEDFWNAYDKKKGCKKDSAKKWERLNNAARQKIMDGLPAYLSGIRDKQYQPYPETFLNSREWENEEYGLGKVVSLTAAKKYTEEDYKNAWG